MVIKVDPAHSTFSDDLILLWPLLLFFNFLFQIKEKTSDLAKLEAIDSGKPLDETSWDLVSSLSFMTYSKFITKII